MSNIMQICNKNEVDLRYKQTSKHSDEVTNFPKGPVESETPLYSVNNQETTIVYSLRLIVTQNSMKKLALS